MRAFAALALSALTASFPLAGGAAKRPPLVGIDHVVFRTSDAASARAFYGDLLGLASSQGGTVPGLNAGELRSSRDGIWWLEFAINSRQRLLIEPDLPPETDERLEHIALATSDLDALAAYLQEQGVKVEGAAEYPPCLRPALRVKDPEGHLIEFSSSSPKPASSLPPFRSPNARCRRGCCTPV